MVVMQRNEVRRFVKLSVITGTLAAAVFVLIGTIYFRNPEVEQPLLFVIGVLAAAALVLALFQFFSRPRRSQTIIFYRDGAAILATNSTHDGYKLRFLRDVLGENVTAFSDEERARWKLLEADGFYAALNIRDVRKVMLLRLCTMIFDDIFVTDQYGRWEYHDASSTCEPTFSKHQMPPLKQWKDISGNRSAT